MTGARRLLTVLILWLSASSLASYGDVEPHFRHCVADCYRQRERTLQLADDCAPPLTPPNWQSWLMRPLTALTRRTCIEQCEYTCMTDITARRRGAGEAVYKYHGHWAFTRHFGLEEPASVLFSLLNTAPHLARLAGLLLSPLPPSRPRGSQGQGQGQGPLGGYYMRKHLAMYPLVSLVAWLSSAVFHAHKTPASTLVDYSSALVFLCYGLWLTLRRAMGSKAWRPAGCVFLLGAAALCARLHAMRLGRVSYDAHMRTCIAVAVITIILWLAWLAHQVLVLKESCRGEPFPFNRLRCVLCQAGFGAASMLELFDFPPLFMALDAHSLWHMCTIPLGFVWYDFWDADEANVCFRESKSGHAREVDKQS